MKSLILKDLYNIGHNARAMLFMLIIFAAFFVPTSGIETYIITSAILCSMMIITTFSFDENSHWIKYAMVTPVTRRDVVAGKFAVLIIFSAIGAFGGIIIGLIAKIITDIFAPKEAVNIGVLALVAVAALLIAAIFGSISIPLLFQYGAEKARTLSIISFLLPVAIFYFAYRILAAMGMSITDKTILILLCCSPVIAIVWCLIMYKISFKIFSGKELN